MMSECAFPWGQMMKFAASIGINLTEFWQISLCEWRAIIGKQTAQTPMNRSQFEALAARFKDNPKD